MGLGTKTDIWCSCPPRSQDFFYWIHVEDDTFLSPLSTNISEWNAVASINKDNLPLIWKKFEWWIDLHLAIYVAYIENLCCPWKTFRNSLSVCTCPSVMSANFNFCEFFICSPCEILVCVSINKQIVSFQNFLGFLSRLLCQGRVTRLLLIFTNCICTLEQHFPQDLWVVRAWFLVS